MDHPTTGPEIWTATGGRVTHLVAGIGTGDTISGTGRYLREQGPVEVVGADPADRAVLLRDGRLAGLVTRPELVARAR